MIDVLSDRVNKFIYKWDVYKTEIKRDVQDAVKRG